VEASDDDLVSRVARGDKAAFAMLVARHKKRVFALALRIVGTRDADDIVQETFTRAWVKAPAWRKVADDHASYAAWLARVAMNLAIDQTRRAATAALSEIEEPRDPALLPDAVLLDRERAARIRSAISALPNRQRIAVALTYDAELSNAKGAAVMGISTGAFELLLVRARRTLRAALNDEHADDPA
jgi:RNA polymerase sigma-70 factor (ECF subfamily)